MKITSFTTYSVSSKVLEKKRIFFYLAYSKKGISKEIFSKERIKIMRDLEKGWVLDNRKFTYIRFIKRIYVIRKETLLKRLHLEGNIND